LFKTASGTMSSELKMPIDAPEQKKINTLNGGFAAAGMWFITASRMSSIAYPRLNNALSGNATRDRIAVSSDI
jgi:hypothetical protein